MFTLCYYIPDQSFLALRIMFHCIPLIQRKVPSHLSRVVVSGMKLPRNLDFAVASPKIHSNLLFEDKLFNLMARETNLCGGLQVLLRTKHISILGSLSWCARVVVSDMLGGTHC